MNAKSSVSFIEMGSGDVKKTATFFSALFDWSFQSLEMGGGWFDTPAGRVGLHGNDPEWGMVPYLCVGDINFAAARVKELGGEADEVAIEEGFGKFCNCRDPQGMRFGLHQP